MTLNTTSTFAMRISLEIRIHLAAEPAAVHVTCNYIWLLYICTSGCGRIFVTVWSDVSVCTKWPGWFTHPMVLDEPNVTLGWLSK